MNTCSDLSRFILKMLVKINKSGTMIVYCVLSIRINKFFETWGSHWILFKGLWNLKNVKFILHYTIITCNCFKVNVYQLQNLSFFYIEIKSLKMKLFYPMWSCTSILLMMFFRQCSDFMIQCHWRKHTYFFFNFAQKSANILLRFRLRFLKLYIWPITCMTFIWETSSSVVSLDH